MLKRQKDVKVTEGYPITKLTKFTNKLLYRSPMEMFSHFWTRAHSLCLSDKQPKILIITIIIIILIIIKWTTRYNDTLSTYQHFRAGGKLVVIPENVPCGRFPLWSYILTSALFRSDGFFLQEYTFWEYWGWNYRNLKNMLRMEARLGFFSE